MQKNVLHIELIKKLKTFNEIFMLDLHKNQGYKNWSDYIDPISRYLFKANYLDFITGNPITDICMPGTLEKYYNIIVYLAKDLETLTEIKLAGEIYASVVDVLRTFDHYLLITNRKVSSIAVVEKGQEKIRYNIYPMI